MGYNVIFKDDYLEHHGILGQKWGHRNGPPYPLDANDHSAAEKKAGWKKSLDAGSKVRSTVKKVNDASKSWNNKVSDADYKYMNERIRLNAQKARDLAFAKEENKRKSDIRKNYREDVKNAKTENLRVYKDSSYLEVASSSIKNIAGGLTMSAIGKLIETKYGESMATDILKVGGMSFAEGSAYVTLVNVGAKYIVDHSKRFN